MPHQTGNMNILAFITFFCISHSLFSKIIYAATTDFEDVNRAVSKANAGDVVQLPEGTSDWGSYTLKVKGGITIKGIDSTKTMIKRTVPTTNFLVVFDGSNGFANELHNIKFEYIHSFSKSGIHTISKVKSSGVYLSHGCRNFKVSGCYFKGFTNTALQVGHSNLQQGVIYHNSFVNNYQEGIYLGYGVAVYGDRKIWPSGDVQLGTKNAVFVEDNYFYGNRHHIASNNSSRYVFRYNTVIHTDLVKNYAMTDAHGPSKSSGYNGSFSFEIYENTYRFETTDSLAKAGAAIGIRGGNGVIFNNSVTSNIVKTVHLYLENKELRGASSIQQGTNELYIWNNSHNDHLYKSWRIYQDLNKRTYHLGISSDCPQSIQLGIHYFIKKPAKYLPFTYPHPLRKA